MTVAEYQQALKDIETIKGQIAQLRDRLSQGTEAIQQVYGVGQQAATPSEPQPIPPMMAAHDPVAQPINPAANVNPFQDNFAPNTNTLSMQEIAGQVAPQQDQPLLERLGRGAVNIPIGMAGMAEQATSDPVGFAKGTGEYLGTWAQRLNPNILSPESMIAKQEFGQELMRDPIGTGLDAAGVAGAFLGLPKLGSKIKGFKSIKEARAAINDIGKPKVDVPEVVQEPIRSETPVEQPTSAAEVVGKAEPTTKKSFEMTMYHGTDAENIDAFDVSDRQYGTENKNPLGDNIGAFFTTKKESAQGFGKNVVSRKIQLGNPKVFNSYDDFKTFLRENTSPNDGLEWKVSEYQDAPGEYFSEGRNADGVIADSKNFSDRADAERYVESKTKNNTKQGGQQLLKDMGYDGVVIKNPFIDTKTKEVWAIAFDNKSIVDGVPTDIPAKQPTPTTATEVVAKAKGAEPSPVAPAAKEKEPWEMTRDEHRERTRVDDDELESEYPGYERESQKETDQYHEEEVLIALRQGKPVPAEVLADYPDLAAKYGAGKISTEQPTATVQDAGATPAQSTIKAKEPWEVKRSEYNSANNIDPNEPVNYHGTSRNAADAILRERKFKGEETSVSQGAETANDYGDIVLKTRLKSGYKSKADHGLDADTFRSSDVVLDHEEFVKQALSDGRPVPPEVLADYPDLAAKYGAGKISTEQPTAVQDAGAKIGRLEYSRATNDLQVKITNKDFDPKSWVAKFGSKQDAWNAAEYLLQRKDEIPMDSKLWSKVRAVKKQAELQGHNVGQDAGATPAQSIKPTASTAKAKEPWEMDREGYATSIGKPKPPAVNMDISFHQASSMSKGAIRDAAKASSNARKEARLLYDDAVKEWEGKVKAGLESGEFRPSEIFAPEDFDADVYGVVAESFKSRGVEINSPIKMRQLTESDRVEYLRRKENDFFSSTPDLAAKYGKPTTAEAVVKKAGDEWDTNGEVPAWNLKKEDFVKRSPNSGVIAGKGEEYSVLQAAGGKAKSGLEAKLLVAKQALDDYESFLKSKKKSYIVEEVRGDRQRYLNKSESALANKWKKLSDAYWDIENEHASIIQDRLHRYVVEEALARGHKVNPDVLKEIQAPTELHAGVNPFKLIDDYMTKRKLVNPVGTPEIVLAGKDIVPPFRKAQEAMRNEIVKRGEQLQKTLEGVKRESDEDVAIFKKLDDPKATLDAREQALRDYYNDLFDEVNKHREARGQEPVKYRKGYITHLVDQMEKETTDFGATPMPRRFRFQFEKARTGDPTHRTSAIDALEAYTKAALKDIYIGDALAETIPKVEALGGKPILVKKAITSPDGKTTNMTDYRWSDSPVITERGYAEAFIKGQMNVPTYGQRALQAMFDMDPNTSMRTALKVSATFYRSLLGMAVDSGVKNLTQGINTAAELGLLPTLRGYAKLATRKGLKAARAEHLLEEFNPQLMGDDDIPMHSKAGRVVAKAATSTLNAPMKVAEFINRGAAYHAAYETLIKKGIPVEQAHEMARAAVRKTQFSYSKIDTSPALRGPFARIFSQFFSYPIKQSEMLYKWAVTPGENGKLARYFLYTGMAVVGAKYAGVDMSGVFFDPIRMVDPNSKEGFQLPGTDKRVTFDAKKLGKSGPTPQGFAPIISVPKQTIDALLEEDDDKRKAGLIRGATSVLPGGRYGKKVYDVITESDETGSRDRKIRENTTKDKTLKLLGMRSTDIEAESSRRQSVADVEDEYYKTRQKMIDAAVAGDREKVIELREEFRQKYPFLYGRLIHKFDDAVAEERKKKGMTSDERFFDNKLRKQIEANL